MMDVTHTVYFGSVLMFQPIDRELKIVIAGESGVGKSSLLLRFVDNQFNEYLVPTIGVDFKFRTLNIDGKRIKLQIWDTAGQENFRAIISAYYSKADGIILVYDLTSWESFEELKDYWIVEAKEHKQQNTAVMIIGSKADLVDKREVMKQAVEEFAKEQGISIVAETSSKTNEGIEEAFTILTNLILKSNPLPEKPEEKGNKLRAQRRLVAQEPASKGCCRT